MDQNIKREILMDNYLNPLNKEIPTEEGYIKVNSNNESCIDNINLYLKIENDIIKDIKFMGEACAISTASTSIMIKELRNLPIEKAKEKLENFENMVEEKSYDQTLFEEANAYDEIYKQQNRKTCALLPWHGLKKALEEYKKD